MGLTLDISVLLAIAVVGPAFFAAFELETPAWRKVLKWAMVIGVTLTLTRFWGHWALLVPVLGGVAGVTGHVLWCRRHGIDPVRATPRRKYYELRGWTWLE
ncbi:MAG TPA: hypothetical protein VMV21_18965 [Vicinamibacteria bacterium]|nr:hypothetical protein [Vicinamibacteria bacterium]